MNLIREASQADHSELEQIYLECRRSTFNWVDPKSFNLSDFKRDTEGEWILVAERAGKIIGFSSVWVQDNFLHHLYVHPKAQGKGVGRSLLDACFKGNLQRPARLKCVIKNLRACEFYEALGWTKESTTTTDAELGSYYTYVF